MRSAILFALVLCSIPAFGGTGRLVLVNVDKPGVGFNDPTPATPVGGNNAPTLGGQRLAAVQAAAEKWQSLLDTNVDVVINVTFASVAQPACTASGGVLAQAYPISWAHSFAGAPRENVWYPIALANKLAGTDLEPGRPDIFVQFNLDIDDSVCFGDTGFYYGLDGQHGSDVDLYVVALHEIAHGLGVASAERAPTFAQNRPAVGDTFRYDETLGRRWDQMSDGERAVSVINNGNLTWDGPNVRLIAPRALAPLTTLTITSPSSIARNYEIGTASFGTPANVARIGGQIVAATDDGNAEGASMTDGCTAYTNAAAVAGNIALVDRGSCTFLNKARKAQAAGAVALIVVDNNRDACVPPGMGATEDGSDVRIPVVSIRTIDGESMRAQLAGGVSAMLRNDPTQLAGATPAGRVRLYAPCTIEPGSSTNHWDVTASPNLLMEPNINSDLGQGVDLTLYQLLDIGWTANPKTGRRLLKR